ncbi:MULTISPECIES: aminopeptidase [unclassified Streptococcus]|uniref:aminopeptidase n=1 Tax=unclassified Streptococcus TaxID=2608887 RepID=UPI001072C13A|nr:MULTISPECIES: aminopeptidase [unclassified Streptococcus]MBF0786339.1 aminopeptidase [Streptococcus sp. 19428wC2_LYSM12]MCQ9212448.1 aminopeptidase [Streptococcus sp. B01]MCQ9213786.1 aminopeptidase [Streptococcus sp. O1]TFV06750.1 aminopeptidase [Streptococcus sp. LYSM12]
MSIELLAALSNADSIASNETEVRKVLCQELDGLPFTKCYDGLGSLIFSKESKETNKSIMICGHLDEVGFMVRTISETGLMYLMVVGGVKPLAQHFQKVRITTFDGQKIIGFVSASYRNSMTEELICDIGASSYEEVVSLGIEVGNMVCFDSTFEELAPTSMYMGKALDNRIACYIMAQLMKDIAYKEVPITIHFAFTSSEEVGIRGAKTSTKLVNPDSVFVIDVATYSDSTTRNHLNQRQVGKGPILTHFDRTLAPNLQMIAFIKKIASQYQIPLQLDMFSSGGTDGGQAHLVNEGKPTVVTIVPVRHGHCPYSLVSMRDINQMIDLYRAMIMNCSAAVCDQFQSFT